MNKELLIAVIMKGDSVLMRKKPDGSEPYKETWYLFGCEPIAQQDESKTLQEYLKSTIGIEVEVGNKLVSLGTETKKDHDGLTKNFLYKNYMCKYVSGTPIVPSGAEKVEWIPKQKFREYDIVPPSVKLLKGLGYYS